MNAPTYLLLSMSVLAGAQVHAADAPRPASLAYCDSQPNAYMRVECRVIVDPAFDHKWRRMTPSEMQDAVDADPCAGFFAPALEKQCRERTRKKAK